VAPAPTFDGRRRPPDLHLRAILERLPIALLRIDAKGSLLAVNQVGLSLLGAHSLEHALGTSFLGLVTEDARESCRLLLESASNGQDGSAEVELRGLTGTVRAVEVHAVAHPGAPDAAPSALVTLRDITRARVLAESLEAASTRQADVEQAHVAERAELAAEVERLRAAVVNQSSGEDARAAVEHQLTKAREDIEHLNRRCGALESEKQQASVDLRIRDIRVSELTGQLADLERAHAARVEELTTAHAARSSEAEAAVSAATAREQDARAALQRAEAAFGDERQRFSDDRQRLESDKQQAVAEAQNHQTRVNELTAQLADLERALAAKVEELTAAHASRQQAESAFTDERQRFADERHRLESEKQQSAADAQSQQMRVGELATRLTDLERAHAAKLEELLTAQARSAETEAALGDERQRFADERQRLESEAAAARDAENAARAAWTTEQTERLDLDRTRQQLVDAIARLAVEAGLPLSADAALSIDLGADAVDRGDSPSTSAW
jgi:PAS domain S-box-containing protein